MRRATSEGAPGGGILFVRDVGDLRGAVAEVNAWFAWRTGLGVPTHEVLGIVIGEAVHEIATGFRRPRGVGPTITLRESVAVSCRWELAFYEISGADPRLRPGERRHLILDHHLSQTDEPEPTWRRTRALLAVLTGSEAAGDWLGTIGGLRSRYAATPVGRDAFLHTGAQGLVRLPTRGPARAVDAHLPS